MILLRKSLQLLSIVLLITSCGKDPVTPTPPVVNHGNFFAKIANKDWEGRTAFAKVEGGHVKIFAVNEDGSKLQFDIPSITPGTYKVNELQPTQATYMPDSTETFNGNVSLSFGGEIILTKCDTTNKIVSGTFHMTLAQTVDKHKVTIEDGYFTDIPIVSNTFESIELIGLYKASASGNTELSTISIDALGSVDLVKLKDVGQFSGSPARNYSFYNPASTIYCFGNPEFSEFLGYNNGNFLVRDDWDYTHGALVRYNGKCYVSYITNDNLNWGIRQLDPASGDTVKTLATYTRQPGFVWERSSAAQDGERLYFLSGTTLESYMLVSGAHNTYNLNPAATVGLSFDGLEVISKDKVLAFSSVDGKNCKLNEINSTSGSPVITPLIDFTTAECAGCNYSSVYDPTKNTYYLFTYTTDSGTGNVTTTIRAFNLNNNTTNLITYSGTLFGVELKN